MNRYNYKISELDMNTYHIYKKIIHSTNIINIYWLKVHRIIKDLKVIVTYG